MKLNYFNNVYMFKRVKREQKMATPGLQKLNIPKKTNVSPKAAIANNLRSQGVAQGTSWGIFAQRTMTGLGVQYNNRAFNSGSISATRHALNDNRTIVNNNIGYGHVHSNNGNNTMNKFMAGMMAMNMLGQLGANIADTVKSTKPSDKADKKDGAGNIDNNWQNRFDTSKFEMTSELQKATSFTSINNIEKQADEKLGNFQEEYSKTGTTTIAGIDEALKSDNVKDGLTLAGVNIDTSKLELSNLKINVDDLSTLDDALKTMDADIAKANKFISEDLTKGIETLTTKGGEIQQQIGTLEANLKAAEQAEANKQTVSPSSTEIKAEIQKLKEQKQQIENAKKALSEGGTVRSGVDQLIKDLEAKQNEIGDIKQVKTDLADKKYQVAQQLKKDVEETQNKLNKLENKINKAKNNDEKNKLIKEFNGLVDKLEGFKPELEQAGTEPIKNSKGKEIDLSKLKIGTYQKKEEVSNFSENLKNFNGIYDEVRNDGRDDISFQNNMA